MDELLPILKRLQEKFYGTFDGTFDEKALLTFVEPMSCRYANGNAPNPVSQSIQGFLGDPVQQTLLIQGAPGSGKTLLGQVEAHHRWQQLADNSVKKEQPASRVIPLWIWLPALLKKAKGKDLLAIFFDKQGLGDSEIKAIQQANQKGTLLIQLMLDGWDEVPVQDIELFTNNGWWDNAWPNIKLIVTSRPEILAQYAGKHPGGYPSFFCQGNLQDNRFTECYLQPFTTEQIHGYLEQYIKTTLPLKGVVILPPKIAPNADKITFDGNASLCWEEVATYEHYITTLPGVAKLAQIPFVLTLLAQMLPRIVLETQSKEKTEAQDTTLSQQALTYDTLYSRFTQQWLHKQARRLWDNQETQETLKNALAISEEAIAKALATLEGVITKEKENDIINHYRVERLTTCLRIYSENLAKAAFNLGQGKLDVLLGDTVTLNLDLVQCDSERKPFFKASLLNNTLMQIIRSGCLLKSQEARKHMFLHKTLLEFFAAERVYRSVWTAIDWYIKNLSEDVISEEFMLNSHFIKDSKTIYFLAEKVTADEAFKQKLYEVIQLSNPEPVIATASSNAITILNAAREDFTDKKFIGVRIPKANLTGALCSYTNFSYADCRGVNFSGACLQNANLSNAYLSGVNFDELTPMSMKTPIAAFAQSPDEQWLALGDMSSNVTIWDMRQEHSHNCYTIPLTRLLSKVFCWTIKTVSKQMLSEKGMSCASTALAFTADSQNLLVVNAEHVLYSINLVNRKIVRKFSLWPLLQRPAVDSFIDDANRINPFIVASSEIAYIASGLDNYYHIQSDGQHAGILFENELFLCKSPDNTHCLTYHRQRKQQVLWNIQGGFSKQQEIFAVDWDGHAFDLNSCRIAISPDNRSWVFMSKDRKKGDAPNYCLQWAMVNTQVTQPLPRLCFVDSEKVSIVFGAIADTLVVYSGYHTKIWDLNTERILQTLCLPTDRDIRLWVNKNYNQLLCLDVLSSQLLRYELCTHAVLTDNTGKNTPLQATWSYPVQEDFTVNRNTIDTVFCRVNQEVILLPNLNESCDNIKENRLISRMALSSLCVALPYGYWDIKPEMIVHYMQIKKSGVSGKLINLAFLLDKIEYFFQSLDVALCLRQYPKVGLRLVSSTPIVALAFSLNSRYLAGLDGMLNIVLWQLSINDAPPSLNAERVWYLPIGLKKNIIDFTNGYKWLNIAVQQQGIVVASVNHRLVLMPTKNRSATKTYLLDGCFSRLTFIDDATLICETENMSLVVFRLMKIDKEYRLYLIYSNEKHPLQLQGCDVSGTLGITALQRSLFRHHKTKGQPARLEIENSVMPITIFSQNQFLNQINAMKAVVSQPFYSQLLTKTLIDYDKWVVTLVRDVNAKDGMHTFLLIEGITTFGKPCYVRMDLANRIDGKKVEPEGFAKIKFSYGVAENLSEQSLHSTLTSNDVLRRNPEGLKGQAWVVSRRQLVALIEHIQKTYLIPDKLIPYSTLGDSSFFTKHHNCYTWAREMLLRLNHPPITKRLPKKWSNYIVNNPGFDLNLRLGAAAAQKDNSSDIVPENSGLDSRQCALMQL